MRSKKLKVEKRELKVVFMGTPEFARVCLDALVGATMLIKVATVITQPDRPSGRGKKLQSSPVKNCAMQHGLPVFQPEKIKSKDSIAILESLGADIFVVAAYGQLLSQKILSMPRFGAINVHASILPKYRGASPIQQAIVDGETSTGITIMQMDKGMDTGDILLKHIVDIDQEDTGGLLHDKLCQVAPIALLEAIDLIATDSIVPIKQDSELASYAPLITKQMAQIEWNKSPKDVVNQIRAYNPSPGAYTWLDDKQVKIWRAVTDETLDTNNRISGKIVGTCPKNGISVAANGGIVRIIELTPSGGKKMSASEFMRGHKIEIGTKLEYKQTI